MQSIWAEQVLTSNGWLKNTRIDLGEDGHIMDVVENAPKSGVAVGTLLPAPANVHSHSFQRAMAGMTEQRGDDPNDNFWSWRRLMYKFLNHLTPEHIEAIAAFVQMEMLEAGFGASAEFHYLHHQADGTPYDNIAELSDRIAAAAEQSGIGLTLLPVLYQYGGCDERPLGDGQVRFGNSDTQYAKLVDKAMDGLKHLPDDTRIGIAPHSLRAVNQSGLNAAIALDVPGPIHIHAAEQDAEVEDVKSHWGLRPVEWLLEHHDIDSRWCLIHATQMEEHETLGVAKSGAVVGLCPITEANLGDGIFDGIRYIKADGHFGIGSDSNIRISLSEELRLLEYSQRLVSRNRAVLAIPTQSTGRVLLQGAAIGGARATQRGSGQIEIGALADLCALSSDHIDLVDKTGDETLDSYIFAGDDNMVTDVWSAGRHMVKYGQHTNRAAIENRYRETMRSIRSVL